MLTCGAKREMEKKSVRTNTAYLDINITPCFPGLKAHPLPRSREEGEIITCIERFSRIPRWICDKPSNQGAIPWKINPI
jgi:hypothetical protein